LNHGRLKTRVRILLSAHRRDRTGTKCSSEAARAPAEKTAREFGSAAQTHRARGPHGSSLDCWHDLDPIFDIRSSERQQNGQRRVHKWPHRGNNMVEDSAEVPWARIVPLSAVSDGLPGVGRRAVDGALREAFASLSWRSTSGRYERDRIHAKRHHFFENGRGGREGIWSAQGVLGAISLTSWPTDRGAGARRKVGRLKYVTRANEERLTVAPVPTAAHYPKCEETKEENNPITVLPPLCHIPFLQKTQKPYFFCNIIVS